MLNDEWTKSTWCSMGTCVEVRRVKSSGHVELRDSKSGLVMSLDHEGWEAFIAGVKLNEFDLPTADI